MPRRKQNRKYRKEGKHHNEAKNIRNHVLLRNRPEHVARAKNKSRANEPIGWVWIGVEPFFKNFHTTPAPTGIALTISGAPAREQNPMVLSPTFWSPLERSNEGLGLGFVANHFDVVPVRTNDESCIVVRVVVRAQTRRTIVFATRLQSRAIEGFDLLAILGRERQVKMRRLLLGLVQAQ